MSDFLSPPFSVVIPLFNKEGTVARCLSSVLKQSQPASEIIVVNDGSTDQGPQEVRKIKDPRISIFDMTNSGVSAARNFGISKARHEYIALLDADDEWDPAYLEKMAALIQKFPEAGLYYSGHTVRDRNKAMATVIPTLPPGSDGYVDIFNYNADQGPWSSASVIRKSFLERTGLFDTRLAKGEDIDMWIRFALKGPVALHNASLSTCHTDAETSAMRKPSPLASSLISNLDRYEDEAQRNRQFYKYLQEMRVSHIGNFLGGNPCEMGDPQREIDRLDISLLPPIWTLIQHSPKCLRGTIFKMHRFGSLVAKRLGIRE